MDIHQALNWRAIWPTLRGLPRETPLSLLDAGCGNGSWCRRVARLRPQWRVLGLDRDAGRILEARSISAREGATNVSYVESDFAGGIDGKFDVVLSIASIHYAAAEGRGVEVLRHLASALTPRGVLVLLIPRRSEDRLVWPGLPSPQGWPVFGVRELRSMFDESGLVVRDLHGLYGSWCVLGKQLAVWAAASPLRRIATLPVQRLVRAAPIDLVREPDAPSYALRAIVTLG